MPPTKVKIERIAGDRSRQNTFHKRKLGLIKKAIELTVLTDCDCAIILRSAPTVMCPEGRFSAYCNKDLHELIGQYMTEPPSEYYTNAEYPRLAKEGYRVEGPMSGFAMQGGMPAIEVDVESGSHLHSEPEPPQSGGGDSNETKELKKRMADMEAELRKFRSLVDGQTSPSGKARHTSATPVQFGQHDHNRKRSPPLSFGSFFPIQNEEEGSAVQTKRQRQNDHRSEQQHQFPSEQQQHQFRSEQQQFRSEQQQESNVYGVEMEQSNLAFLDDIEQAQVAPNGLTLRRETSGSMNPNGVEMQRYHPVGREPSWDFSSTQPHPGMNSKGLTPFVTPNLLPGTVPPQCPPFPTEEGNEGGGATSATHPLTYSLMRALQRQ